MTSQSVCIIGLGYIGLPTAAIVASRGVKVLGVDVVQATVDATNIGQIRIVEHELGPLVRSVVESGHLRAATKPEPADVFIIAVPTPFKGDYQPDISFVLDAARSICTALARGNLVILESTSPVGTTEHIEQLIAEVRPDLVIIEDGKKSLGVAVAYCPERVLPGKILQEIVANDRIIGGTTSAASRAARDFYKQFVEGECLITTARTAELCKLAENSFRDVNIAFANELSIIADRLNVDPWELIELANHHPRVNILQPGPGVGGHCIAVDPWFIVSSCPEDAKIIRTAREVNDHKPDWVVEKVVESVKKFKLNQKDEHPREPVIACLGLAFKANIDDLRESPAVKIVEALAKKRIGEILAVEPHVQNLPKRLSELSVTLVDVVSAFERADIILLLVDHKVFEQIRFPKHVDLIDTRGLARRLKND